VITAAGYTPFLDPIHALHEGWYFLLIPLAFGISMIYRALRMERLDHYWRAVAVMTVQVVVAMVALAVVLVILVQGIIPLLPVD
jgi:hypothetical protein